jgi:hypothetical protein
MVTGIFIPHETTVSIFEHDFGGLSDYQAAVGGHIEPVYLQQAHLTIFANEEGKVYKLPVNRRATCLWWLLSPTVRGLDILVGDIVLIGSQRGRGSTTDVPQAFMQLLMETRNYKIEVQTVEDPAWYGNENSFDNYFEAAIYALNLLERWPAATDVRVVEE